MRLWSLTAALLCITLAAPAQIVINEFSFDDTSTDDREFVELFNAGQTPIDISGWTVTREDASGPQPGGNADTVTIPTPTLLNAQDYYVIGDALVPNVDQMRVSGWLQNGMDAVTLRDPMGAIRDTVAYESNKGSAVNPILIEGNGIWMNHTSIDFNEQSLSRYIDGRDTNDNGADFGNLAWTPGTSNNVNAAADLTEDFDALTVDTAVPGFGGSWVLPQAVDPVTPGVNLLTAIPASPQGGNACTIWDPAGGGNMAYRLGAAAANMTYESYVYIDNTSALTGADDLQWSIGVRGSTGTYYNTGAANGNSGVAWRYIGTAASGAILELVDEGPGGTPEVIIASIPIVAGTNDGWQRIRLEVNGGTINANFGGTIGNPADGQVITGTTTYNSIGTVYFGFREFVANNNIATPIVIDDVRITTAPEFELNSDGAALDINGTQASVDAAAISNVTLSSGNSLNVSSTAIGFPWDIVISFEAPIPSSSPFSISSAGGQIVNVNLVVPIFAPVWFNGGSTLNLATSSFPGGFSAFFTAPGAPGTASAQMVILDPSNVESFSLSQAAGIDAN